MPALDYVFSIRGRGGQWSLHSPYNNPCRSQLVEDFGRGTVRYVRQNGPLPVAAHPLTRVKLMILVDSLGISSPKTKSRISFWTDYAVQQATLRGGSQFLSSSLYFLRTGTAST
jgi:hypothetical protein